MFAITMAWTSPVHTASDSLEGSTSYRRSRYVRHQAPRGRNSCLYLVISHAHYDHLSLPTVQFLNKRANSKPNQGKSLADSTGTHFFAPLGNKKWFEANGIAKENCSELDWWDQAIFNIGGDQTKLRLTATPCQHFANRGLFDRNHTLWSGWAVEQLVGGDADKIRCKVFFGGDTAYRGRPSGMSVEEAEKLPYCPAFEEVGRKFGGFDFSVRRAHRF